MTLTNLTEAEEYILYSTCPPSKDFSGSDYLPRVREVAEWSEQFGCRGILVYTDNRLADPWVVSREVLDATEQLEPLVAVQPVYMHPFSVAKMISTIGTLYNRRIALNMVAGGFKKDLEALGDHTPHDDRYVRLQEYTQILKGLLEGEEPVSIEGKYYEVDQLSLSPSLPEDLYPDILLSGSSDAGLETSRQLNAVAIQYPQPSGEYETGHSEPRAPGIRVGIIARPSAEEAWRIANERFPGDREGQLAHKLAMKTSDSQWHQTLSEMAEDLEGAQSVYWLHPFENYKTFCPYLVGSYDQVADELRRYMDAGFQRYILDIPREEDDLRHTQEVFNHATMEVAE